MKNTSNLWKIAVVLAIFGTCAIAYSLRGGISNDSGTTASISSPSDESCSDVHKGDSHKACPHSKGDSDGKHPHHDGDASTTCPHSKGESDGEHPHHHGHGDKKCPHSEGSFSDKAHTELPEGHPEIN